MANPVHLEKLNEGVDAWNRQHASDYQLRPPDFNGADLRGRDFSGANLVSANFSDANLQGVKLGRGTSLRDANFNRANLSQADLSGADLQDAHFEAADLRGASFRGANLVGAHLREAVGGLRTEQYAGADLTGAELPKPLEDLDGSLENVKGISESARKIFLAVLAACLYCWLTIATTTNVNLITNRASSPLPIIQTQIPIVGFYVVAPLLVLCVYFYFHFYLQKLWEELGSLPAVFPDGRPLYAKVEPWLLNDLVRAHLPKLNVDRPFLSYLQLWISVLLAWWVVPITMFLFWGRYLRRHEKFGVTFHVALLVISLVAAVCLYRLAVATLGGAERKPFAWKTAITSRRAYQTAAFVAAAGVLFGLVSLGAIWGVRSNKPIFGFMPEPRTWWVFPVPGFRSWVPRSMALLGYPPFANIADSEVSQKKPNWTAKNSGDLDSVAGAQLPGTDLRYASAEGAFLARANLRDAHLIGAALDDADLTGASLTDADLTDTTLDRAHLGRADLNGADLTHASLMHADLTGANLGRAQLSHAHLDGTDLSGACLAVANLTFADLSKVHLSRGDLEYANLSGAKLLGADLKGAYLRSADLRRADLRFADLRGANLIDTYLSDADMADADLTYSDLRVDPDVTSDIDLEMVKRAAHWDRAFYNDDILEALGLSSDHNEKLREQQNKEKQLQQKQGAGRPAFCSAPEQ